MKIELTEQEVEMLGELLELDLESIGYESEQIDIFEGILEKLSSGGVESGDSDGKVYSERNDYSHFGLTQEDQDEYGEVTDSKQAFMDGYSFGDRQLEGVMFLVTVEEDGRLSVSTQPEYADYMSSLNEEKWLKTALDYAEHNDMFESSVDGEDVSLIMNNGDYSPQAQGQGIEMPNDGGHPLQSKPITIQKTTIDDILGRFKQQ